MNKSQALTMVRQVVGTLGVRGLLIAAGFISSVATARLLGPEGKGVYFYWATVASLIAQFGNFGLQSSNTYFLAKGQASLAALASNALLVSVVGGGALGGLVFFGRYLLNGLAPDPWAYGVATIILACTGLYFMFGTNLLIALGRIKAYNGFELINRYFVLAAIIAVAWLLPQAPALLLASAAASMSICIPLCLYLRRLGPGWSPSLTLIRRGIGYSARAYLITALGFLMLRLNTFVLPYFVDDAALGTWSIAAQMMDVINIVPSTVALILLPGIIREQDPYRLMKRSVGWVGAVLMGICLLTAAVGDDFIVHAYGERFSSAYPILLWGLPGVFCLGLIAIYSQYLASVGMPFTQAWIWAAGLCAEAVLAVCLIPSTGIVGGMVALSCGYLLVLAMIAMTARRHYLGTLHGPAQ